MSSVRNMKIISVVLIIISLSMLFMPWITLTGLSSANRKMAEGAIDTMLEYGADELELGAEVTPYAVAALESMKDLALSPSECASFFPDIEGFKYSWFLKLYGLMFLLVIAAGIYAVVFAIRRKPLLKGFDGFVFPAAMLILAVMTVIIVFVANDKIDSAEGALSSLTNMLGEYGADLKIGVRFTLWMILAVITSLPFVLWEDVLARSGVGQKAIVKMDQASSKIGEMIDKGNEKIQNYSVSWVCPKCGAHVSGESMFCPKCGTKKPETDATVKNKPESQPKSPEFCPSCGAPVSKGDRFCKACGFDLDRAVRKDEPENTEEDLVQELVMTEDEACSGSVQAIDIPGRGTTRVKLPGGLKDGQKIRLKGMMPSDDGTLRDLIVRVQIAEDVIDADDFDEADTIGGGFDEAAGEEAGTFSGTADDEETIEDDFDDKTEIMSDDKTEVLSDDGDDFAIKRLHWDDGNGNEDIIVITGSPFVVGRSDKDVDHVLEARGISRRHFFIDRTGADYYVTDMNSTNGVKLNGEKIEPMSRTHIELGDVIGVGDREYTFEEV